MSRVSQAVVGLLLVATLCACSASSRPTPTVTVTAPGPTVTVTVPGPTVTVTADAGAPGVAPLTDGQRATLDSQFGAALGDKSPLAVTYCPMDEAGRSYYAKLVASQLEGYTIPIVLQYLREACGH